MSQNETPFSISPNPLSLHLTESLKSALQKSRHVINYRQGLSVIVADVGFGKSTLLRYLWSEYGAKEDYTTIYIPTANFASPFSMLKDICLDFDIEPKASRAAQERLFKEFLVNEFASERNVVIFIDEAQNLDNKQLELIRGMLNFETNDKKLIQIILAGQNTLDSRINDKRNSHLKSRMSRRAVLNPLSLVEAVKMIDAKCRFAEVANPFSLEAIEQIHNYTANPRSILKICDYLWQVKKDYELAEMMIDDIESIAAEVGANED